MSPARPPVYYVSLVDELRRLPRETEWVEFKHNNADPQEIGEYLSALANAAALASKAFAYLIWGIEDATHEVVGTSFSPSGSKKGNEPLETWLHKLLTPAVHFAFHEVTVQGLSVVVLEIERATHQPVQFGGQEFIRVGSGKKSLKGFPEKEKALWKTFETTPFESGVALEHVSGEEVLRLLDYPSYFLLSELPLPESGRILETLKNDRLVEPCVAGGWNITNLGALLFAHRLTDFAHLGRKTLRIIEYVGNSRIETRRERLESRGYASAFEAIIQHLNTVLPSNEVIGPALRKVVTMFPPLAIRELVANALIHQDLTISGAGPTVEIFDTRVEITNPGVPLVPPDRFLDIPPRSRNEALASLMRRFHICEERGTGIDKVVFQIELFQLPAPLFEVPQWSTKATLFAHKALSEMDKADRIRACYLHACLRYINKEALTNTSLRGRFGIAEQNSATASRIIKETLEAGLLVPADAESSKKYMRYFPWWTKAEFI